MMKMIAAIGLTLLAFQQVIAHDYNYEARDGALQLPEGLEQLGDGHGEIDVDAEGRVYVSVQNGAKKGIQVYDNEGKYLHNVKDAPADFHGFTIHKDDDGKEYIYGAQLQAQTIVKLTLDGEKVLEIKGQVPAEFIPKGKKGKAGALRLTGVVVGPNGDIYAVDGYGADYIHRFDKEGKYIATFGGRAAPYSFKNCHKISIDTRFEPARILCCDRANNRLVHLDLDGKVIGDVATGLRKPSALDFHGDDVVVAEIKGRISILDKEGKIVKEVSLNEKAAGNNKDKPETWKLGVVNAPHGICYDKDGNIWMTEYNAFGRVHRFDLKK